MTRNELNDIKAILNQEKVSIAPFDNDNHVAKQLVRNYTIDDILTLIERYANGEYPAETLIAIKKHQEGVE